VIYEPPNRPFQQPNALPVRSETADGATPRAAPAAPRACGTICRDLGRPLLNGQVSHTMRMSAGVIALALLALAQRARAEETGAVTKHLVGADLLARNGDVLSASVVGGYAFHRADDAAIAATLRLRVGLGGISGGPGIMGYVPCLHDPVVSCMAAGVQGVAMRTWGSLGWPPDTYLGGEIHLEFLLFKLVVGALHGAASHDAIQIGLGVGV
jgi:hypothetical protein